MKDYINTIRRVLFLVSIQSIILTFISFGLDKIIGKYFLVGYSFLDVYSIFFLLLIVNDTFYHFKKIIRNL